MEYVSVVSFKVVRKGVFASSGGHYNYDIPPGFFGVFVESIVLGKALLTSVEKESMMIRPVLPGGLLGVGCETRAMRCARVGVEKWVRFSSISDVVRGSGGEDEVVGSDIVGRKQLNIWENRGPDRGCDASINCQR